MKALLLAAVLMSSAPGLAASPIEGAWANPQRSVTVRIAPCGDLLCGRVISASAQAKADAAEAGTPRLVGTDLMRDLEPAGEGMWRGDVFVADRNVHAEGEFRLTGPRSLEVKGCAFGGLICKTQAWARVGPAKARRR